DRNGASGARMGARARRAAGAGGVSVLQLVGGLRRRSRQRRVLLGGPDPGRAGASLELGAAAGPGGAGGGGRARFGGRPLVRARGGRSALVLAGEAARSSRGPTVSRRPRRSC